MPNQLSEFRRWLLEQRRFRVAWFAKDPQLTAKSDEALSQLPDEMSNKLLDAINELPVHASEQERVLEAIKKAMAAWKENAHLANNSIVIIAHPVSSVSRILVESLSELRGEKEEHLDIKLLDWIERPPKPEKIQSRIKQTFDIDQEEERRENCKQESTHKDDHSEASSRKEEKCKEEKCKEEARKCLAVIPNLCWCFLRSTEGLAGVDYLQDTLLDDRNRFWVIGSGQVGWEYLKSTLKLHAYCGDTVTLPKLNGEQLQNWLEPVIKKFDIRFRDTALHERLKNPDSLLTMDVSIDKPLETVSEITQEVSATIASSVRAVKDEVLDEDDISSELKPRQDYFIRLADISDGVSVVALQLFVRSLRYREITEEEEEKGLVSQRLGSEDGSDDNTEDSKGTKDTEKNSAKEQDTEKEAGQKKETGDSSKKEIIAVTPKLPPLPELSQSDMYLLYSLMLHGDLTIRALAESLGDAPQIVNNQVQVLRNAGIIEQKDGVVKTNPVHYPRLRRELSKNNFIIEVN